MNFDASVTFEGTSCISYVIHLMSLLSCFDYSFLIQTSLLKIEKFLTVLIITWKEKPLKSMPAQTFYCEVNNQAIVIST